MNVTDNQNNSYVVNDTIYIEDAKDKELELTGNVENVTSANAFYMVQGCVQDYLNNITSKNTEFILNQLSSSYIKNNKEKLYLCN